ncbi:MAG: FixG Ig-like domain-containing protein, partial [Planctomycetota bacterium]
GSQDGLEGKPTRFVRMRTLLYPLLLAGISVAFLLVLSTKYAFDTKLLRGAGNPFNRTNDQLIVNTFRLRLNNRTNGARRYRFDVIEPIEATTRADGNGGIDLPAGGTQLVPISVSVPVKVIGLAGALAGKMQVTDDIGNERVLEFRLLGPR